MSDEPKIEVKQIDESRREEIIELINQFYKKINSLTLDGIFKVKKKAATKMVDVYLKIQGTGKLHIAGVLENDALVSLAITRIEERPFLEEEKIAFIDLAVTKQSKKNKGYMKLLIDHIDVWAKQKDIKIIELRAIKENEEAVKYWKNRGFDDFYIRYRKKV